MTSPHDELQAVITLAKNAEGIANESALNTRDIGTAVREIASGLATVAHYIQTHLDYHLEKGQPHSHQQG